MISFNKVVFIQLSANNDQNRIPRLRREPVERESMEFDVVIVGAGPSGLATAIRLRQLAIENEAELTVCVLEKGSEVGAHMVR